jgi:methylated-DNA-[protein]-cysteine S-methyltransferase
LRSIQRKRVQERQPSSSDSFYDTFESPIGTLYLIVAGKVLRRIDFKKPAQIPRKDIASHLIKKELKEYFEHGKDEFTQKIDPVNGTEFEKNVWLSLREIPFGETRTYKWLAEKIGKPNASRAVGQALGKNPLPIILPCHRIIESDGSLGGYSGGIDIKRRLLDMEYYIKMEKNGHARE